MLSDRICKTVLFISLSTLTFTPKVSANVAEPSYEVAWGRQIGTPNSDYAFGLAADAFGNSYVAGYTDGSLAAPNAGRDDAFISKLSASGDVLWSRQLGSAEWDYGYSVAVDGSGNAYLGGYTEGSLAGTNAGGADSFLAKYSASGDLLWSRQFGAATGERGRSVAVDAAGNAYIAGTFINSTPNEDVFLAKYDASGNFLWSQQLGTPSIEEGMSVAVDNAGNAFVTGYTHGQLGDAKIGLVDAFLVKYDGSGNLLWTEQFGTTSGTFGRSVAVDSDGNAYVSGATEGNLGATNAGFIDAFVVKYDATGNHLWSRQIGTTGADQSFGVGVDAFGYAYLSGMTEGDIGGPNAGFEDVFLAKYDSAGALIWTEQAGTPLPELTWTMAVAPNGIAFVGGQNYASLGGPFAGAADAFVVKFAPIPEPSSLLLFLASVAAFQIRCRC